MACLLWCCSWSISVSHRVSPFFLHSDRCTQDQQSPTINGITSNSNVKGQVPWSCCIWRRLWTKNSLSDQHKQPPCSPCTKSTTLMRLLSLPVTLWPIALGKWIQKMDMRCYSRLSEIFDSQHTVILNNIPIRIHPSHQIFEARVRLNKPQTRLSSHV